MEADISLCVLDIIIIMSTMCVFTTEASGCRSTHVSLAENQLCLPNGNPMPNITCIDNYILSSGECEGTYCICHYECTFCIPKVCHKLDYFYTDRSINHTSALYSAKS